MRRIATAFLGVASLVLFGAGPTVVGTGTVSFTPHLHDQVVGVP